jgi:hypothetical protein
MNTIPTASPKELYFRAFNNGNGSTMHNCGVVLFDGKVILAEITGSAANRVLIPYNKARIFDFPSMFSAHRAKTIATELNKLGSPKLPEEIIYINV